MFLDEHCYRVGFPGNIGRIWEQCTHMEEVFCFVPLEMRHQVNGLMKQEVDNPNGHSD